MYLHYCNPRVPKHQNCKDRHETFGIFKDAHGKLQRRKSLWPKIQWVDRYSLIVLDRWMDRTLKSLWSYFLYLYPPNAASHCRQQHQPAESLFWRNSIFGPLATKRLGLNHTKLRLQILFHRLNTWYWDLISYCGVAGCWGLLGLLCLENKKVKNSKENKRKWGFF